MADLIINSTVTVEVTPTPAAAAAGKSASKVVRRPFDALSAYKDTYAALVAPSGSPLLNSSETAGSSRYTTNFIIQSISHSAQEKSQVTHTFSEDRVFFFGSAIDTLQVDALLVENRTFQWLQEWYTNYKSALSGSEATTAAQDGRVTLQCEDREYEGFITEMSTVRTAQDRHGVQLRFTMLVANVTFTRDLKTTGPKLAAADNAAVNALNAATTRIQQLRRIAVADIVTSDTDLWGLNRNTSVQIDERGAPKIRKLTAEEELGAAGLSADVNTSFQRTYIPAPLQAAYPTEFLSDSAFDVRVRTKTASPTTLTRMGALPDDQEAFKKFVDDVNRAAEREAKATQEDITKDRAAGTSSSYVSSSTLSPLRRLAVFGINAAGAAATGTLRGIGTQGPNESLGDASLRGLKAATWDPFVDIGLTAKEMYQGDQLLPAGVDALGTLLSGAVDALGILVQP